MITTKLATDVLLIKSIFADANISYDTINFLDDNRVLISFDGAEKL